MKNKKTFVVFTDGGCDAISKIGASAIIIIDPDIDGISMNGRMLLMILQITEWSL